MAKPLRNATKGTFFVTAITANRRRLFQVDRTAKLFLETLQKYRAEGHYKLHAFVVMPDHIHLLLTTENLPQAMQRIKGGFSRALKSRLPVWQSGYAEHPLFDRSNFESRRTYRHENPVREGRCEQPQEYPYSSAFRIE